MAFVENKVSQNGNHNQPKSVDVKGKFEMTQEGVSKSGIYLKKWSLPLEVVKARNVFLAGVMDHVVRHKNESCFDTNYDADVDQFDDRNKNNSNIEEININGDVSEFDIDENNHRQKYFNEFDIANINEFDVEKVLKKI